MDVCVEQMQVYTCRFECVHACVCVCEFGEHKSMKTRIPEDINHALATVSHCVFAG